MWTGPQSVRSGLFGDPKIEGPVMVLVYGPWGQKTGPDFQTLYTTQCPEGPEYYFIVNYPKSASIQSD